MHSPLIPRGACAVQRAECYGCDASRERLSRSKQPQRSRRPEALCRAGSSLSRTPAHPRLDVPAQLRQDQSHLVRVPLGLLVGLRTSLGATEQITHLSSTPFPPAARHGTFTIRRPHAAATAASRRSPTRLDATR